ncbi:MAG: hypothetical protein U1F81_17050 [Verrucomicrobiaceae bacterium]
MLEFALWPLWRLLKGPLQNILQARFSILGRQFKALLSSTVDDLIAALTNESFNTDIWRHAAEGTIRARKSSSRLLSIEAFPLEALQHSSHIKAALVVALRSNVRLDAQRNELNIPDAEWHKITEDYATDVLRLGLVFALRRMKRQEIPLYTSNVVLDIAEREPIRVRGKAGHHTLVILCRQPHLDSDLSLRKAARIWKAREDEEYQFELKEYDGFNAA